MPSSRVHDLLLFKDLHDEALRAASCWVLYEYLGGCRGTSLGTVAASRQGVGQSRNGIQTHI